MRAFDCSDVTSMEALVTELDASYLLTDTCVSLAHRKFAKDVDAVVSRARAAGVQRMVCRATNDDTFRDALRLCRLFPETLFCCSGFAPSEVTKWTEDSARELQSSIESNAECVAVGEIGLDFSRDSSPRDSQLAVFEACLEVAQRTRRPALIWCRDALSEAERLLREFSARDVPFFVVHDFKGSAEDLRRLLATSPRLFVGLSGQLFRDHVLLSDLHALPLSRMLLESDAPWNVPNTRSARLPPEWRTSLSARSLSLVNRYCTFQRNEPSSLPVLAELVAAANGLSPHEVALQTTYNALKVFAIK